MNDSNTKVNHFRARVEMLLRKRGWTLAELSRQMGKSPQSVKDIVDRGDPKASTLKEFTEALGVTSDDLLEQVTAEEYGETMLPVFS